eukprot:364397-Chlamydomonas_euryale.AAC.6
MLPHAALHAPCSVRSVASSTSAAEAGLPTDKIHLLGARFYGYHGALPEVWCKLQTTTIQTYVLALIWFPPHGTFASAALAIPYDTCVQENVLGQPFEVDTTVTCDLRMAGQTDHLDATVNYAKVHNIVKDIVTGPPRQLIESVAEAICARVLEEVRWLLTLMLGLRLVLKVVPFFHALKIHQPNVNAPVHATYISYHRTKHKMVHSVRVYVRKLNIPAVPAVVQSVGEWFGSTCCVPAAVLPALLSRDGAEQDSMIGGDKHSWRSLEMKIEKVHAQCTAREP